MNTDEVAETLSFPKTSNPFCWLRREDKIRAEHGVVMQDLRKLSQDNERESQTQIQSHRDALFASLAANKGEMQRLVDELRIKQALEIERRAHAEGRAHAMAELWRRGGFLGRSLIEAHGQRQSGRMSGRAALSDTNSVQGEDGGASPGQNEEDIATAALAAAASRALPGVDFQPAVTTDVPGAEPGSARDMGSRSGAASPMRSGSLRGCSGTSGVTFLAGAPVLSVQRQADHRISSPGDGPVPMSSSRRHESALRRALAPPPPVTIKETDFDEEGSATRSASRGASSAPHLQRPARVPAEASKGSGHRTSKGIGKAARPSERTLPRAKLAAAPPAPMSLGQRAARIGEEL